VALRADRQQERNDHGAVLIDGVHRLPHLAHRLVLKLGLLLRGRVWRYYLKEGFTLALGNLLDEKVWLNVAALNDEGLTVDKALLDIEVAAFAHLATGAHIVIHDVLVCLVLKREDGQIVRLLLGSQNRT